VVAASYPGASPEEMERLVIKPIEDQIDGIDHLDRMSATAQEGRASVIVQFKLDTNLDFAAIDVQRRVDTARVYMPTDLDPPVVDKSAGNQQAPILELALSSKTLSGTALSDLVDQRIVPDIRHIPDVQSVDARGEVKREFHVTPDPLRMIGTGATLPDIFNVVSANNQNLPGGRLDSPSQETEVSIRSDIVRASDMLGIPLPVPNAATGISTANGLTIGNIASTEDGHVEQRIVSKYNGSPSVILDVNRVITADEIHSTDVARAQLAQIAKKYPAVLFEEIEAPAEYTQASLTGVIQSLVEGIVLTAVVLMFFLHAWRNAAVVMISIPVSLLATFIVMNVLHFTLDIVSLMGLSLIIGILVDDSIVVLENITRHRDMGKRPFDAAIAGRGEIGGAAVAITLVDVVVFLPIAFLSGIVGKYMIEFGIVVVVATLVSLLVSFTLTPMLAARWSVRRRTAEPPRSLAWFQNGFERLTAWYRDVAFAYIIRHRWLTVSVCLLLLVNAMVLAASQFAIALAVDAAAIAVALLWPLLSRVLYSVRPFSVAGGASAKKVVRLVIFGGIGALAAGVAASFVQKDLGGFVAILGAAIVALGIAVRVLLHLLVDRPRVSAKSSLGVSVVAAGIASFIALLMVTHHGIDSEFIPSTEDGSIYMTLTYPTGTPLAKTQAAADLLESRIIAVDGVKKIITTTGTKPAGWGSTIGGNVARMYAGMDKSRRRETNRVVREIRAFASLVPGAVFNVAGAGGGGGGGDPIFYTLSGPEDVIQPAAEKLAAFIRALPGTTNVQTGAETEADRLNVVIDRAKCAVLGVSPGSAATAARIAIGGAVATRIRTVSGLVDVRVQLPAQYRNRLADVQAIKVRANDGSLYRLADVASFSYAKAPTKIERLDKQRVVRVTGGFDPGSTTLGPIVNKINAAVATPGFFPNGVSMRASGDSEFFAETMSSMGIALLTSFTLVYVLMVILYGSFFTPAVIMLSVPVAIVGALFGLAATHQTLNLFSMIGIIMLFGLVAKNGILLVDYANTLRERGESKLAAIKASAYTRFRPIIMTSISVIAGNVPLALALEPGSIQRASLGIVVIGGITSSLILTLLLVPIMYILLSPSHFVPSHGGSRSSEPGGPGSSNGHTNGTAQPGAV
ncbi:MAG: acrb/acrd/acrf family transport protein, partial [Candidatus Eremiobacteraeota bacterium]|nr:acrb/acrd/acrf family transport protein [Candidatus Eremiobacteraeota bacterium]